MSERQGGETSALVDISRQLIHEIGADNYINICKKHSTGDEVAMNYLDTLQQDLFKDSGLPIEEELTAIQEFRNSFYFAYGTLLGSIIAEDRVENRNIAFSETLGDHNSLVDVNRGNITYHASSAVFSLAERGVMDNEVARDFVSIYSEKFASSDKYLDYYRTGIGAVLAVELSLQPRVISSNISNKSIPELAVLHDDRAWETAFEDLFAREQLAATKEQLIIAGENDHDSWESYTHKQQDLRTILKVLIQTAKGHELPSTSEETVAVAAAVDIGFIHGLFVGANIEGDGSVDSTSTQLKSTIAAAAQSYIDTMDILDDADDMYSHLQSNSQLALESVDGDTREKIQRFVDSSTINQNLKELILLGAGVGLKVFFDLKYLREIEDFIDDL